MERIGRDWKTTGIRWLLRHVGFGFAGDSGGDIQVLVMRRRWKAISGRMIGVRRVRRAIAEPIGIIATPDVGEQVWPQRAGSPCSAR